MAKKYITSEEFGDVALGVILEGIPTKQILEAGILSVAPWSDALTYGAQLAGAKVPIAAATTAAGHSLIGSIGAGLAATVGAATAGVPAGLAVAGTLAGKHLWDKRAKGKAEAAAREAMKNQAIGKALQNKKLAGVAKIAIPTAIIGALAHKALTQVRNNEPVRIHQDMAQTMPHDMQYAMRKAEMDHDMHSRMMEPITRPSVQNHPSSNYNMPMSMPSMGGGYMKPNLRY